MLRRFHLWRVRRRIDRILRDAGWTLEMFPMSGGRIRITSVRYADTPSVLTTIQDAADTEFPGFANFYVKNYSEPQ